MLMTRIAAMAPPNGPPPAPPWVVGVVLVGFVVGVTVFFIVLQSISEKRSSRRLEEWLRAQGLTLVSREATYMRGGKGPFGMTPKWTTVFYLTARDASGSEKTGKISMGNFFVIGGPPTVHWDGPRQSS